MEPTKFSPTLKYSQAQVLSHLSKIIFHYYFSISCIFYHSRLNNTRQLWFCIIVALNWGNSTLAYFILPALCWIDRNRKVFPCAYCKSNTWCKELDTGTCLSKPMINSLSLIYGTIKLTLNEKPINVVILAQGSIGIPFTSGNTLQRISQDQ